MSRILKALRLTAYATTISAGIVSAVGAQEAVRIGTSGLGSPYYIVGVGMSELVQKYSPIKASVETVGGSVATLFALATKRSELGMVTSYNVFTAFRGEPPFKKPVNVSLIAQGQKTYRLFLVRKGSGITKAEDLIGKRIIGKRPALGDLAMVANAVLKAHGIRPDQVTIISTTTTNEAYSALRAGTVDAAFVPGSPRSAVLQSAFNDDTVTFFPIEADKADAILKALPPAFIKASFPKKLFKGEARNPFAFGMTTYLVARDDISEATVHQVAKAVLSHTKELRSYHAAGAQWTTKASLSGPAIPFHPGAIKYFREIGAWTAELDALQEKNKR